MSSSTLVQPGPMSDGLSSLVLSKKYLACAKPPHLYKLDHENLRADSNDGPAVIADGDVCGWQPTTAWGLPSPTSAAVQARYEPSDVFTPLVFEEIQLSGAACPSPQPQITSMWLRPTERLPPSQVHPQLHAPPPGNQRRPLQHLPPPAQSTLQQPATKPPGPPQRNQSEGTGGGNRPGDLSWLVNFQVASIFEPTYCNGTVGGACNVIGGEWQEPEMLKQKKKFTKTDQKRE